jgi:transketolase
LNRTSDTKAADSDPVKQVSLDSLKSAALQMRRDILSTIAAAGSGHPGGSLSAVELLTSLYYTELRHDPSNPDWPDRDKFILSKAHACPVLYVVLAHRGYFPKEELRTFRKIDSRLQGHAHTMTPGVEMSGGSLGQGLSFAVGAAMAGKLDGRSSRVFAMLGDGECDEGQVWEAAMSASHYRLDNLVAIVDRNGIQNDRFTSEVMNLEPLPDKWRSFGWHVIEIDGHSFPEVLNALDEARSIKDKPTVIIAATVKGKGVSFMENNPDFHGKAPSAEQLELAFKELAD